MRGSRHHAVHSPPAPGINFSNGLFPKERFHYDPAAGAYHCPGGQMFDTRYNSVTRAHVTIQYSNPAACARCPMKTLCTKGRGRRVNRWEKEEIIERVAERLTKRPDILVLRR